MNSAPRWPLAIVALSAVCVVGALAWATVAVVRLEERERHSQADSAFEESVRLALWRIDSALTPLIAREAGRPYFQYQSFYPADRPYSAMPAEPHAGDVLVPSPLLRESVPFVRLHFQRVSGGPLASPEAPTGRQRYLAESARVPVEKIEASTLALGLLDAMLGSSQTDAWPSRQREGNERAVGAGSRDSVNQSDATPAAPSALAFREDAQRNIVQSEAQPGESAEVISQVQSNLNEFSARKQAVEQAIAPERNRAVQGVLPPSLPVPSSLGGPVEPGGLAKDKSAKRDSEHAHAGRAEDGLAAAPSSVVKPESDGREERQDAAVPVGGAAENKEADQLVESARIVPVIEETAASSFDGPIRPGDERAMTGGEGGVVPLVSEPDVEVGDIDPRWYYSAEREPHLVLFRTVRVGDVAIAQGCWLDWPALHEWLAGGVRDLLPGLRIEPITMPDAAQAGLASSRRLAAIPAEIRPVRTVLVPAPRWTPLRTTLLLTWASVLAAFGGLAWLVRRARDLADRRGRFVSAVTHELRTPLTTFVLYSQMLADGMVRDDAARQDYLATLKRESLRLAGIVENVIEYARLGTRRRVSRTEPETVANLLAAVVPDLLQRAEQASFSLEVRDETTGDDRVRIDSLSLGRLLYNLVDNACKYASGGTERSIQVRATIERNAAKFEVSDHGPGVLPADERRLFKPFQRGSSLEHASMSGLGLGLSLSRETARQAGGDVRIERTSPQGSTFALVLPLFRS